MNRESFVIYPALFTPPIISGDNFGAPFAPCGFSKAVLTWILFGFSVMGTCGRAVFSFLFYPMQKRFTAGFAYGGNSLNGPHVSAIIKAIATFQRTKTRISMLKETWWFRKLFPTVFTNCFLPLVPFVVHLARKRTKLLASGFRVPASSCLKWFITIQAHNLWLDISLEFARPRTEARISAINVYLERLTAIFTCFRDGGMVLLSHLSAPFGSLCNDWGRMAKVSIFSTQFMRPRLSLSDYITGGQNIR
jgi:hypothetical protein